MFESGGLDETDILFGDIDVAKFAPEVRCLRGTNQGLDDPGDLGRRAGVRELEHVAFGHQPVAEIDSLDGETVAAGVHETSAFRVNEVLRCGGRGSDGERDDKRQDAELAETKATSSIADAHRPSPFRISAMPKSCQLQRSRLPTVYA